MIIMNKSRVEIFLCSNCCCFYLIWFFVLLSLVLLLLLSLIISGRIIIIIIIIIVIVICEQSNKWRSERHNLIWLDLTSILTFIWPCQVLVDTCCLYCPHNNNNNNIIIKESRDCVYMCVGNLSNILNTI